MSFQCVYFPKFIPRSEIPKISLVFTFPWTKESLVILLLKLSGNDPSFLKALLPQALSRCCSCFVGLFIELQVMLSVDSGTWVLTCLCTEIIYSIAWVCQCPPGLWKDAEGRCASQGTWGWVWGCFFWSSWNRKSDCSPFFCLGIVGNLQLAPSLSKGCLLNWTERKCAICKCHVAVLLARGLVEQFPSVTRAPTIREDLSLAKLPWYSHQYLLGTDTCREQQSICCSWLEGKATSWSRFQVKSLHELALVYWFRKHRHLQQIYQVGEGKCSLFLICKGCLSLQKTYSEPGFLLQNCFLLWTE